jgi:hypothetical protein
MAKPHGGRATSREIPRVDTLATAQEMPQATESRTGSRTRSIYHQLSFLGSAIRLKLGSQKKSSMSRSYTTNHDRPEALDQSSHLPLAPPSLYTSFRNWIVTALRWACSIFLGRCQGLRLSNPSLGVTFLQCEPFMLRRVSARSSTAKWLAMAKSRMRMLVRYERSLESSVHPKFSVYEARL